MQNLRICVTGCAPPTHTSPFLETVLSELRRLSSRQRYAKLRVSLLLGIFDMFPETRFGPVGTTETLLSNRTADFARRSFGTSFVAEL